MGGSAAARSSEMELGTESISMGLHSFEDIMDTDWEGYIWKQGHVVRNWRNRYAVLSGTCFTYYASKEAASADLEKYKGRVTVTGAKKDPSRSNGFVVTTSIDKLFTMYTKTPIETELWIRMIEKAVQNEYMHSTLLPPAMPDTVGELSATQPLPSSLLTLTGNNLSLSFNGRTSNTAMNASQAGRLSLGSALPYNGRLSVSTASFSAAMAPPSIRSSIDWKNRNVSTTTHFYNLWSTCISNYERKMQEPNTLCNELLALFPLCSMDVVASLHFPVPFMPSSVFYGREGLVDMMFGLAQCVSIADMSVHRVLLSSRPNVILASGRSKLTNRHLKKTFDCEWKDEVTLSPGGRVLSVKMYMEVDPQAFYTSDSDERVSRLKQSLRATATKRVLSLSMQHFTVKKVLGQGTFGTVVLTERKTTGEIFAIKILDKNSMSTYDKVRTRTEMRILRDVYHPFIAPLRFSFQSNSRVFLGMEYYPGGSLYVHMNKFSEDGDQRIKLPIDMARIKFYAAQLVLALCHLHACDIVYRDLKPDNIMLDKDGNVALVDFGLSKTNVRSLEGARTMAGSPAYTAPELLKPKRNREYGKAVDWWCLGILLYEMMFARRPFHHPNVSVLYRLIDKDPVKFPSRLPIAHEAKSLIVGLLEKDPTKRLGAHHASDILVHPFFKGVAWDQVLKKKITPPWKPDMSKELPTSRRTNTDLGRIVQSKTPAATASSFFNIFGWRPMETLARRQEKLQAQQQSMQNDFGHFSYVCDSTPSFLVDEDEMLDSAFSGRRSVQLEALAIEA
ncbi:AGC/AKT protein kinase [Saprolegnia diclina VS20]|uniref:AGC/AKT protein kinase n=1 Tax=Saprolegnia diclina (strain VS20) TaxID=1156394 RepID=T0QS80_SAPDV|nr:AGC/AKT protein kinase [Saprolegnia diclina VS20]EQC37551.1 AGC/AKT protein kinase [Saprolegnia diclina VS20]|eukprot:XP_008609071.1 AGC/AKT protein kinase [Saprolegnia diclina VS20]